MEESVYLLAKKLSEAIKNNPLFLELDKLESEMNNNDEVIRLTYQKDMACTRYSDILKIKDRDDPEAKKLFEEINSTNKKLNEHPLVKKYNDCFIKVRNILTEVNNMLFGDVMFGDNK